MKRINFILLTFLLLQACSKEKKQITPVFPVTVVEVTQGNVPTYIDAIGNVNSLTYVQIRPQVTGIIMKYYVKEGDYVKANDPLLLIDPRPYEIALKKAEANLIKDQASLKFSEEQVARNKTLVNEEYVSKLNFQQFQSQVDINKGQILSDEADIATAKLNLEWTKPVSPIDGKISERFVNLGNLVLAGDTKVLTDIRQIDPADISFNIPQGDYIKLTQKRNDLPLKFLAYLPQKSDAPREGNIYFIDNHFDTNTGTIRLKGTIPNKDDFFLPGQFVKVKLILNIQENALLVPEESVKIGQEGNYLYVYNPETSTVEYRKVVKGSKSDGFIAIESGIKSGEKVVVQGQNNLLPGAKVSVVSQEKKEQKGLP
jgi:membrane fusion protein, multidrug efflux system